MEHLYHNWLSKPGAWHFKCVDCGVKSLIARRDLCPIRIQKELDFKDKVIKSFQDLVEIVPQEANAS